MADAVAIFSDQEHWERSNVCETGRKLELCFGQLKAEVLT